MGEMIEESDIRNIDGDILVVHGVNKDKKFMPSVARGTDLSKYKIVRKGQFACNLMHVGRDVAVPIALHKEDKPIIVSPAYFVFNLIDDLVLPEYAMMWLYQSLDILSTITESVSLLVFGICFCCGHMGRGRTRGEKRPFKP